MTSTWRFADGYLKMVNGTIEPSALSFGPGSHFTCMVSCILNGCRIEIHPEAENIVFLGCRFVACEFEPSWAQMEARGILQQCDAIEAETQTQD